MSLETTVLPAHVLKEVEDKFGAPVTEVLSNIFSEMIFKNNLHIGGQGIEN